MFTASYLEVAGHLVQQYNLQIPLYLYVKEFFKQNKKYGSRDRKYITELVFGYYRMPKDHFPTIRSQLMAGSFLSGRLPKLFYEKVDSDMTLHCEDDWHQRLSFIEERYNVEFVPLAELSCGLSFSTYLKYLFQSKKVFIRIRKNLEGIQRILKQANIEFKTESLNCISFHQKIGLETILPKQDEYVIQDWSTQQVMPFLQPKENEKWWDCCAASGGKSLMLLDKQQHIELFGSDIRASIIENYKKRLKQYHYNNDKRSFVHDASYTLPKNIPSPLDVVIADVPCCGSGTWAQAPEQGYFFSTEKLEGFSKLQLGIAQSVISSIRSDGRLYYMTCSVWKHENEDIVATLCEQYCMELEHAELFDGSTFGGDYLYMAILRKL